MTQLVKNLPAMRETWVPSLGWEDPLEKRKATHSSVLAWRFHGLYSPWGRKESDSTEQLSLSFTGVHQLVVGEPPDRPLGCPGSVWTSLSGHCLVGVLRWLLGLADLLFQAEGGENERPHLAVSTGLPSQKAECVMCSESRLTWSATGAPALQVYFDTLFPSGNGLGDFHGGPGVKESTFQCRGYGFNPSSGN